MKRVVFAFISITIIMNARVEIIERGLAYNDVLLVPQRSTVESRRQAETRTRLTRTLWLNMPLVSANMDTVTEASMAIAMAQAGGIGIIHRFNSIEDQIRLVQQVKQFRNAVIKCPRTICLSATLAQARALMDEHQIKGLLVVDGDCKLAGIITSRDVRFNPDEKRLVKEFMTSREYLIVGIADISIADAKQLMVDNRIEKLPLVNADDTIAGLITSKDIYLKSEYPSASVDAQGRLMVGAAIGVKDEAITRAAALLEAGADVLVIDIAHGHSDLAINTLKKLKEKFPDVQVIAGNVATPQGTRELIEAGADAVKIGIGPGSICTTRIVSGSGYPQLSAVINCAQEADKYGVPVIADGGICYSGDITKAIAAGAATVMLGSLLAGTDESPGIPFMKNGKKFKVVRGMASFGANLGRSDKDAKKAKEYVAEGVEALTPYKGSVLEVVQQLLGGLYSGMSYCGVTAIEQLRGNGVFVEITSAGIRESHPHDVQQLVN